jgi:prephenate dehydrogenase
MEKVAIIGLGLLGTSLALALKKAGGRKVLGWTRNEEVRRSLLKEGVLDGGGDEAAEILRAADISVLCMPVAQIVEFCKDHAKDFKAGSIVTDVGSVKGMIMDQGAPWIEEAGCVFIGSHPMAGSEKSGPGAAKAELFQGAAIFLTPSLNSPKDAVARLRSLWESVGGVVAETDASTHDNLVAKSSHLPHAISWALSLTALDVVDERKALALLSCANSFRDMTRVSESSPDLWAGIMLANRQGLLSAIDEFKIWLDALRSYVETGEGVALRSMMERGKALREEWRRMRNAGERQSSK